MTGIYFLLDKKKVVYIGQSKSLPQRVASHKDKKFDSIRMIGCAKSKLSHYEQRLIGFFQPKYNKSLKVKKFLNGDYIHLKLDNKEQKMLGRMCHKNKRSRNNQIIHAMKQAYYRQFDPSKLSDQF